MAISPNTNFSTGQVFTSAQANAFPRGVMAYNQVTTNDTTVTATEEVQITSSAFTAVANRYYRITYYEPQLEHTGQSYIVARIRKTNLAGTELERAIVTVPTGLYAYSNVAIVTTFAAGSTVVVATLESTNTASAYRAATFPGFLVVEDIGGA
jgi:hypothetical protein